MIHVACVIDKKGRVQEYRCNILKKYIRFNFDVIESKISQKKANKYDVIYFASIGTYKKNNIKHPNICVSITSHKCIDQKDKVLDKLGSIKVSVNSSILFSLLKNKINNLHYIPNGVDVGFFYQRRGWEYNSRNISIGWVGNKDRKTKNFYSIVNPLKKWRSDVFLKTIATSKSSKKIKKHKDILRFYHSLDYFLISSSTEGTPNPGLEAASCGIPIISTRVGNMIDVVKHGHNGYFINDNLRSAKELIAKIINDIDSDTYKIISDNISNIIRDKWSWEDRVYKYKEFLYCI